MRVVIGEDEALMRDALTALLEADGFDVVGLASDGEDLVRRVRAHRPELDIADIRMPPPQSDEGLRAALAIRAELPRTGVLLLSRHAVRGHAEELLAAGAGYLLKQGVAGRSFSDDLRQIAAGPTVLDPEVVAAMLDRGPDALTALTDRQREVLALMAGDRSNAAISERLGITPRPWSSMPPTSTTASTSPTPATTTAGSWR